MPRKLKFRPVITRVRLNPEQAVLACQCFSNDRLRRGTDSGGNDACDGTSKTFTQYAKVLPNVSVS